MKKNLWIVFVLVLSLLVLLAALASSNRITTVAADDQVAIIVNPANPVTTLSVAEAQKIFLAEKSTWPNGKRIVLLMAAPGTPNRDVILKKIYKMSDSEFVKYFIQAGFTGEVSAPPKDVSSAAQIKQLVAANAGAIGYVGAADTDDTVKVVLMLP